LLASMQDLASTCVALLGARANPNQQDASSTYPIHNACSKGNKAVVAALVENQADLNLTNRFGNSALIEVCGFGFEEIATLLLENTADPNIANQKHATPLTKAFEKGHSSIVDKLMQYDCELDEPIRQGHFDKIMALVDQGSISVHWASPSTGYTILHNAARCEHELVQAGIVMLLGKGLAVNTISNDRKTALHLALETSQLKNAQLLLDHNAESKLQDQNGVTPLHRAAGLGSLDLVRIMIDRGADINLADDNGQTPIIYALKNAFEEVAIHLIEMGAAFDVPDNEGRVPLQLALEARLSMIVPTLLDTGPNIVTQDANGMTVFHTAVVSGCVENVKAIVTRWHGANGRVAPKLPYGRDIPNKDQMTPLLSATAMKMPEMVSLLLEHDANSSIQDLAGNTPLHLAVQPQEAGILQQLLSHEHAAEQLNIQNSLGQSPVHLACELGNTEAITLLLQKGADFQVKDYTGKSPIDYVHSTEAKSLFEDWAKVQLMYPVNVREICVPKTTQVGDFVNMAKKSVRCGPNFAILGYSDPGVLDTLSESTLASVLKSGGRALDETNTGSVLFIDPTSMACPAKVSQDLIDGRYLLDERSWRWSKEASQQLAFDITTHRRVSLKFYADEKSFIEALELHDNIGEAYSLRVVDTFVDTEEDLHAVVTEWDDTTLAQLMSTGRLLVPEILVIVRSLALLLDRYESLGLVETKLEPSRLVRIGRDWKIANFDHLIPAGQWMKVDLKLSGPTYVSPEVAASWRTRSDGTEPRVLCTPSMPMWHFGLIVAECFRGTPCYTQSRHTLESLASPEDSSWIVSDQHATELLEGLLVKEARNRLTAAQVLQQVFVELPATLEDTSPCVAAMLQMQSSPIMNMSGIQGLPGILPAQPSVLPMAPPIPRAVPSANLGREQQQEMKQLQHRVTELQSQCKDASDKQLKAIRSLEVKVGDPVATSSTCSIS